MEESSSFKPVHQFFKFGKRKNLEEMRDLGKLYMKNLEYYVDYEEANNNHGRGDKNEGVALLANNIRIYTQDTNILVGTATSGALRFSEEMRKPVYCLTCRNIVQNVISYNHPKLVASMDFDEKFKNDFSDDGELCVLVIHDVAEFLKRFDEKLSELGLLARRDFVKYKDLNYITKENDQYLFNTVFTKSTDFCHQFEYRLVVDSQIGKDECFEVYLGDLSSICTEVMRAEPLLTKLRIEMNVGKVDEES
ncbi:hypothetical protein JCM17380_16950 [Desulfosporosinus burensis]